LYWDHVLWKSTSHQLKIGAALVSIVILQLCFYSAHVAGSLDARKREP
jgi:hypothetical protein